jgi:hypothetical protein
MPGFWCGHSAESRNPVPRLAGFQHPFSPIGLKIGSRSLVVCDTTRVIKAQEIFT